MKKNLLLLLALALCSVVSLNAQVAINQDSSNPDPSAMLDVKSTERGFLAPRMTAAERAAIPAPAEGLLVYQTNAPAGFYYFRSGSWQMLSEGPATWAINGSSISNLNSGNVGIGNPNPLYKLDIVGTGGPRMRVFSQDGIFAGYLSKNNTREFFAGVQGTYETGNTTSGYHIYDNTAGAQRMVIDETGKMGIGESNPTAKLHVAGNLRIVDGTQGLNRVLTSDATGTASWQNAITNWSISGANIYNNNPGNVGIGITNPIGLFGVHPGGSGVNYASLGYSNAVLSYFQHNEDPANGDGQASVYGYRTRTSQNDGISYSQSSTNTAIKGYNFWGDVYTFGVGGFSYNDYTRTGGVLGADVNGIWWGSLGYKNSGAIPYGGYFTSSTNGSGKSSQAHTSIGIGAWGDLMGADIHGQIYGLYAEGDNYATFSNGPVYKNNVDVHLQKNASGSNSVLYTNVSTDVTIQTSGVVNLTSGSASIVFDPVFAASASSESPVIITVTPVGNSNGVYLDNVSKSGFTVVENNAGKSNVTVNYIAIAKRAGYENPTLAPEVIDVAYISKLNSGLHNDADLQTNGEGLYYENGELKVGIHPSALPDPNKPAEEAGIPTPTTLPE